jgi:hypothetical protein|tara:strand:- start:16 stop:243 length:228 start_codon:yes stop_codon:yes gene_type:complete
MKKKTYTFEVKQSIFYEISASSEEEAREELCNNFDLIPSEDCILDDAYRKAECITVTDDVRSNINCYATINNEEK